MKNIKNILILIIIFIGFVAILGLNTVYGAENRTLNFQSARPYSNDNIGFDDNIGNDFYLLTRQGPKLYHIVKIFDTANTQRRGQPSTFTDYIYCLRGGKGFGESVSNYQTFNPLIAEIAENVIYKQIADMKTESKTVIDEYENLYNVDLNRTETIDGETFNIYNAILWIADNSYLPLDNNEKNYNAEEFKKELLNEVGIIESDHQLITDDDLEVMQQLAFWYFANYDEQNNLSSVSIQNYSTTSFLAINGNNDVFSTQRAEYLDRIYDYFIENAIANSSKYGTLEDRTITIEEPTIEADQDVNPTISTVGNFYAIGPFKINKTKGNIPYTIDITLKDADGKVIPKASGTMPIYYVTEEAESMTNLGNLEDVIEAQQQFYIKINSIYFTEGAYDLSQISLSLTYSYEYYNNTITMWESTVNATNNQAVGIIEKEKINNGNTITITTETAKEADLSLRKFITKINDDDSYGQVTSDKTRVPKLDTSRLNTMDSRTNLKVTTARYIHPKNTVQVKTGDKVVYTIRIYNEGEIDGTATKVVDYLPEGLQLVPSSQSAINLTYKWTMSNDEKTIETDYLKNLIIKAYDSEKLAKEENENWQKAIIGPSGLSYVDLQVECEVVGDSNTESLNLRNIAEITEDNLEDRDSTPENIGNQYNPKAEENGYFPGEEDDDDREELVIPAKEFDVALRKFMTKLNETELTGASSRLPKIDILDLKNSQDTTARYIHPKDKLTLEKEDLITYTIRVYNEGSLDGKITEITDYIPEGLEFVENNQINQQYEWIVNSNGSISTNYLEDSLLKCYDPTTTSGDENVWQKAQDDETGLYYFDVQVVCKIKNTVEDGATLTNIAEITGIVDENNNIITDRDSIPNNFPDDEKVNSYDGNSEDNGYFKGQEDDDDFERVTIKSEVKLFDLALRKYITKLESVEGTTKAIVNTSGASNVRDLNNIDVSPLNTGATTASYEHRKDPVVVETGDVVTYTLRVFNEGETDGQVTEIKDILPEGVELYTADLEEIDSEDENIEIWEKEELIYEPGGYYIYTFNKTARELTITYYGFSSVVNVPGGLTNIFYLKAYDVSHQDEQIDPNIVKGTGWINGLNYGEISFKCKVTATTTETNKVLTNVARIAADAAEGTDQPDRDSNPEIFNNPTNLSNYKGDNNNKSDLSDNEYFYKGQEDDDDFEKLIILGRQFDLSLRKYITSINGEEVETDRTPKIDMTTLENKISTTAKYEHSKNPIVVKQGDIITYTIRVYNEGDRDGKATEITDYIPEGLGLLIGYNTNVNNLWQITDQTETVKLSSLNDVYNVAKNNFKISDFTGVQSLDDIQIATGNTSVTSTKLENDNYLIKAYDETKTTNQNDEKWQKAEEGKGTTGLYYQDIEVACIVLAPNTCTDILRNIAEISKAEDSNGNKILASGDDRDSVPNDVNINTYNPPEDNSKYQEDDDDYEPVILKYFDLALRKFITSVNDKNITSRIPQLSIDSATGNIKYTHPKEESPVKVVNNDVVTYTLRIFNEGTIDGYAVEITDDIPKGLEFLPDHTTNGKYRWVMYREIKENEEIKKTDIKTIDGKNYVKTEDSKKAQIIVTDYLSKENEKTSGENLLQIFDSSKALSSSNPNYLDVKVAFKVTEPNTSDRTIINSAQISEDTDKYGRDIDDCDSIPNEWNNGEDDQDKEYIHVEYFDLSLLKWVTKTIVTVDGKTTTTQTGFKPNQGKTEQKGLNIRDNSTSETIAKVEIDRKKLKSTVVKFVYSIEVSNEGELPGFATEITDFIPSGLEFKEEDNKAYGWMQDGENKVKTRALEGKLLNPGESEKVEIVFTWKNNEDNLGLKTNIAEITEDYNDSNSKDIDSTTNNKLKPYEKEQEDDDDYALVILSIKTGATTSYLALIAVCIAIIGSGTFLIKKYVLV